MTPDGLPYRLLLSVWRRTRGWVGRGWLGVTNLIPGSSLELLVFGTNHRVAPAAARDRLALSADEARSVLDALVAGSNGSFAIGEAVVLSTCTRTEIFAWTGASAAATRRMRETLGATKGNGALPDERHTFSLTGPRGARHLFRVAAGLDSLMIGEPQVLGQVRRAYLRAEEMGSCGPYLSRLFQAAVRTGKRARAETGISEGSASVAFAAVRLAINILSDISRLGVLVVGAGRTGAHAARKFAARGPAKLTIVNRTLERARAVAEEVGAVAHPFDRLGEVLKDSDVVVTATSAPNPVLRAATLRAIMKERRGRPLVVIDIANPRDVESSAAGIANVFLRDLDSLGDIVQENLIRRSKQIPQVERIVEEELRHFLDWYDTLKVVPVLKSLRERFQGIAREEVRRHRPGFDGDDHDRLERYTNALVARLLHQPTRHLRELDLSTSEGRASLAAVRELFQLTTPDRHGREDGASDRNGAG